MTKDAFWFHHDSNAREDEKIMRLRADHGWAGYGIYWAIIEKLREQCSSNAYAMLKDCDSIAYGMQAECSVVKSIIEDYNLFDFEGEKGEFFFSLRLRQRMASWDAKKLERKEKAKKAAKARWGKNAQAKRKQCSSNAKPMPIREEKRRINIPPNGGTTPPEKEPESPKIDHSHPAVQVFRDVVRRYPNKTLYQELGETVGEDPEDLDFWRRLVYAWVSLGWNDQNVHGMLENYRRRNIPTTRKKSTPEFEEVIFDDAGLPVIEKSTTATGW